MMVASVPCCVAAPDSPGNAKARARLQAASAR